MTELRWALPHKNASINSFVHTSATDYRGTKAFCRKFKYMSHQETTFLEKIIVGKEECP